MKIYRGLKIPSIALMLVGLSLFWGYWTEFVLLKHNIGFSYLVFNIILLLPIFLLMKRGLNQNRYTKFLILVVAILSMDIFYYNNEFVAKYLPFIVTFLILIIYLSVMCRCSEFYQQFFIRFNIFRDSISILKIFINNLFHKTDKTIIKRVAIGFLITIPFLIVFTILFSLSDGNFNIFITNIFTFDKSKIIDISQMVLLSAIFLIGVIKILSSNRKNSYKKPSKKELDIIIIGIFLGMINLLFISFVLFQIKYFFGGLEFITTSNINLADYARSGFFELLIVMGLASIILLYFYKNEIISKYGNIIKTLQITLALQVLIIGISSLNKIYIYQSMFGTTTLRYYIEWFTYFLIILLAVFMIFLIYKKSYSKFLNYSSIISLVALMIISSINIDRLIVRNHIKLMEQNSSYRLDYNYLASLSIDAIEAVEFNVVYKQRLQNILQVGFNSNRGKNCSDILDFHLGYCLKKDKMNKYKKGLK
ncbi:MAG: DUF4173 domain-containing protein [Sulfurovum sp.]